MGQARRIAWIFTPYVLTIVSLICLIIVAMGCTKPSSDTLNNLYFLRFDLQDTSSMGSKTTAEIQNILNKYDITSVSAHDVSDVVGKLQADSTLADFYQIGLSGYCAGDVKNDKATVKECSKPKNEFYFDPLSVWGLDSTSMDELSKEFNHDLNVYKTVSKWMYIAYITAFIMIIAEILVGFFALYSRTGGYIATVVALLAFLFTTAASVTSTTLISLFDSSRTTLKAYGISLSVGKQIYTATWLAVVFSLGALIFWTFIVCCCSGRSLYAHRDKNTRGINAENYEPLDAGQLPFGHQQRTSYSTPAAHGGDYPMTRTKQ